MINKKNTWAYFVIGLIGSFFLLNYIISFNYPAKLRFLKDIKGQKVCIEKKTKIDRGYMFNDSIVIGQPYYIDYDNRSTKDRDQNMLYSKLRIGTCILLTDHPEDSIYLVEGLDTTLYINLYPKDGY